MKYIAKTWQKFIKELEADGYRVDASDKRKYRQWIEIYKNGIKYDAEVAHYTNGDFELQSRNITKAYTKDASIKVKYNPVTMMNERIR